MAFNYKGSVIATEAGKIAYNGIKVNPKPGTSFSGIRKASQTVRMAILAKREEIEGQCNEIAKTYSSSVASPMIKDLRDGFDEDVRSKQKLLSDNLERITEGRRKAIANFTMIPPSDEQIRLINAFNGRDKDTVSETEWSYLVSAVGSNYLAMRMVESVARKLDRTFVLPFTPDDALKDLDVLDNIVDLSIKSIAVPDEEIANSNVIRFYNYDGEDGRIADPFINGLVDTLDSSAGMVIPDEYKSINKRLIDAKELAYDNDNISLSVKIGSFMRKYEDQLQTPAELKQQVYEQAEQLINEANESTASDA